MWRDIEMNRARGERYCRQAAIMGDDVALFAEMWSTGYASFAAPSGDPGGLYRAPAVWTRDTRPVPRVDAAAYQRWVDSAVDESGPYMTAFRALARELYMAIAVTYLQR